MTAPRIRSSSGDRGSLMPHRRQPGEDAPVTDAYDELRTVAVEVARDAGRLLRARPATLHADAKTTPTDAVTVMDRAADRLIVAELTRRRPGDRILTEESGR